MLRRLILLLIAGAAVGCSVGPRYYRPVIAVPPRWRVATDTATTLADVAWWQIFRDSVLQHLISTALVENQDLRLAIARVREAKAQYVATRGAEFPQINAVAAYIATHLPLPGAPTRPQVSTGTPTTKSISGALSASYELDVFARLRESTRAARADWQATASERQYVLTTVISEVAQAYFELLRLDRIALVTRGTVASRQVSLDLVQRRFADGVAGELDVRRAEQELAQTRALVPGVELQIQQTENRLSILLGHAPAPVTRGMVLGDQATLPDVPAGLPSTLLQRRPDIREAELRLVAANAQTRSTVAKLFPRVTFNALYGTQTRSSLDLDDQQRIWLFLSLVQAPLFHGGTLRANAEAARAREQQAAIEYEQTVLQAFRDVDDALEFWRTAGQVRAQRNAQVIAARRALDLASVRYAEGIGNYLDVLDAERQLFSAEIDLASAMADQLTAIVQIYQALGGGWDVRLPIGRGAR